MKRWMVCNNYTTALSRTLRSGSLVCSFFLIRDEKFPYVLLPTQCSHQVFKARKGLIFSYSSKKKKVLFGGKLFTKPCFRLFPIYDNLLVNRRRSLRFYAIQFPPLFFSSNRVKQGTQTLINEKEFYHSFVLEEISHCSVLKLIREQDTCSTCHQVGCPTDETPLTILP